MEWADAGEAVCCGLGGKEHREHEAAAQHNIGASGEHARTSLHEDIRKYREKLAYNRSRQKDTYEKVMERWEPIRSKAESWDIKADGVGGGLSEAGSLAGMWRNERNETITIETDGSWKREEAGAIHSGSWDLRPGCPFLFDS